MALDLPTPERAAIAAWRDGAIAGRDDLRPVSEEALHVTLAFLGYRPEKEIPAIAAAIASSAGDAAPLLVPGRLAPLPPRRPRLFALELEDPENACAALQGRVSEALESGKFYRPEKRPFWPHVTLARVKRDRRAEPLRAGAPPVEPFRAREITLYRSLLRPQGARYEALARTPLGRAA